MVKYGKVDICSIQYQFYRDEDSKCVVVGEEFVYFCKYYDGRNYQVIFYVYYYIVLFFMCN